MCSSYGVRTDPFTIENMPSIVVAAFLVYCQARVNEQPAARRADSARAVCAQVGGYYSGVADSLKRAIGRREISVTR